MPKRKPNSEGAPYVPGLYTGLRIRTLITDWNNVSRGEVTVVSPDDTERFLCSQEIEIPIGHGALIGNYCAATALYEILWDKNAAGEDMGWCLWQPDEIRAMATCGGARLPKEGK